MRLPQKHVSVSANFYAQLKKWCKENQHALTEVLEHVITSSISRLAFEQASAAARERYGELAIVEIKPVGKARWNAAVRLPNVKPSESCPKQIEGDTLEQALIALVDWIGV